MFFSFDEKLMSLSNEVLDSLKEPFSWLEDVAEYNQQKVLSAFHEMRISESHFVATTGYGYGDRGRDALDRVYAKVFGTEDALVRYSFASGTHTIAVALFGLLRPGERILSITGSPYDTIHETLGLRGSGMGSLKELGVSYSEIPFSGCEFSEDEILGAMTQDVRLIYIQRSCGYDSKRGSLKPDDIDRIAKKIKAKRPDVIIFVDNCYGEFVDKAEPLADVLVGSLIKNPGGGLARSGGYIAGRADLIEKISYRMTAPGIGREVGASLGQNLGMFQGLFFAPHVVKESLKTAIFCAGICQRLGFETSPKAKDSRADIIQRVTFHDEKKLIAFCQGMQKGAPVDAFAVPHPWDMPGYEDPVIMAAGAFTQGASIELSADGPVRPPYSAFMQGGLTFESGKTGVLFAIQNLLKAVEGS